MDVSRCCAPKTSLRTPGVRFCPFLFVCPSPLDAHKYLELETSLVLLIVDALLTSTVSQHVALAQKIFMQVNKWTFYSATQEICHRKQHCPSGAPGICSVHSSPGLIWILLTSHSSTPRLCVLFPIRVISRGYLRKQITPQSF